MKKETGLGRSEEDRGGYGELQSPPQLPVTRCLYHLQWPSGARHSECSKRIGHWDGQSRQFSASLSSELVVGQQRSIDIADVFQFEMSPVSPALIDEYGCLREGDKAVLAKSLSLSRLHVLETRCWLMPAILCTTSSGQSPGLQEAWLQASAFDWPTTLLSP